MSMPDFKKAKINFDILVLFSFTDGIVGVNPFRFSCHRTVDQPKEATWRFSNDLRGAFYGLVKNITSLREGLGIELKPKTIYPTVTLTIIDDGCPYVDAFKEKLKEQDYGSKSDVPVGLFLVEKGAAPDADTDLKFVGHIEPGSVKYGQDRIEISLTDRKKRYDIAVPQEIFSSDSKIIDPAWRGKPKPMLFGDWSDLVDEYQIEAVCVDTESANDNLRFQLSNVPGGMSVAGFGSYVRRIRRGYPNLTVSITNTDPSQGRFEASGTNDGYYGPNYAAVYGENPWEEGDKWYVYRPKGLENAGILIENPAAIWYQILEKVAGAPSAKIDLPSYATAHQHMNELGLKGRKWICETVKVSRLLDELCFEFGLLWHVKGDKFYLALVSLEKTLQSNQTWFGCNILKDNFEIKIDPAFWIKKGILLQYRYNPRFDTFNNAQAAGGSPHVYMKANWIWDQDSAATRAGFFNLSSTRPPKLLCASAIKVGLEKNLTEKIAVERGDESGDEYQIYNINQDLVNGITDIEAYSLSFSYERGAWTDDAASDWANSDSSMRSRQGFWTDGPVDNDGDCDPQPGDQEEKDSNWTEG